MSLSPQVMLVEEKGLNNQIKRLSDLVPDKTLDEEAGYSITAKYLQEQLNSIIEDLEVIRDCIKSENDRILTYKLKNNV